MDWSEIARKTLAEVAATVPDDLPPGGPDALRNLRKPG